MHVTNILRPISALFVAGLFCSLAATAAPPILRCPEIKGLCRWQEDGWELYWKADTPEDLVDFAVIGNRVVVLLRGHMSPGRVVVLNEQGKTLLVRHLATGYSLHAVVGDAPGDLLVLCNGPGDSALCETWVPGEPMAATLRTPWVPDNCLFPRFLAGRLFCVEVWPEPILKVGSARPISGAVRRTPLAFEEAKWLENLHPLGGELFIVEAAQKLFRVNANGEALQLSKGGVVFWSRQVSPDEVVFSECWIHDSMLSKCVVASVGPTASPSEVWQSDQFWPIEFAAIDPGRYILKLVNDEEQALAMLELEGDDWIGTIVWRGEADSAAVDEPRSKSRPLLLIGEWVNFAGYEITFYEDGLVVYWHGGEAKTSRLRPAELSRLTDFLASDEFAAALDLLRDSTYRSGGDDMHEVGFSYRGESFGYSVAQAGCDKVSFDEPVARFLGLLNELAGRHFSDVRHNPIPNTVCRSGT